MVVSEVLLCIKSLMIIELSLYSLVFLIQIIISMKKTLILGATENTERYAYLAAEKLTKYGHEIVPVGIKKGNVFGKNIISDKIIQSDIDTLTLYVGVQNQSDWVDYILETNPKRIIFNPGTENTALEALATSKGIQTLEACTLVLLSTGQY